MAQKEVESEAEKMGYSIALALRENTNQALGDLLTTIEASTPEGHQLKALKQLVKQRMWILTDSNQQVVYSKLGTSKIYSIGSPQH